MATLTVTVTEDFRDNDPPFGHIDTILFDTSASPTTAIFAAVQFDETIIATNVAIVANINHIDHLQVILSAAAVFSAANWTFQAWDQGLDLVFLDGSSGADTITGANVTTSIEGRGGADELIGRAGADDFVYSDAAHVVGGESIDGNGGSDEIVLTANAAFDFRNVTISDVESLNLVSTGGSATFQGSQIGTGLIAAISSSSFGDHSLIVEGASVNLSALAFTSWDDAEDSVIINGDGVGTNFLTGSTRNDIITAANASANASARLTGLGGADTLNGSSAPDRFQYLAGTDVVTGETIHGNGGTDTIVLQNAGAIDFSGISISGVERLLFEVGNSTATFTNTQIGSGLIESITNSGLLANLVVNSSVANTDLSTLTFVTFGSGTVTINGTAGTNTIVGSNAADIINGLGGGDNMKGGFGSDTYTVGESNDIVDEVGGNGTDLVLSGVTFDLDAIFTQVNGDVENLTLTGAGVINGSGNEFANTLIGNLAANVLNGRAGGDVMRGLGGGDTYHVDDSGDVVDESTAGSGGNDLVNAVVDFSLSDLAHALGEIERLTLGTGAAIAGTGNGLDNTLIGNANNNSLDGRSGADTMFGLSGNDTYFVDSLADIVDESVPGSNGVDTVQAEVSYSLGANALGAVEHLTLLGAALNGTGNGVANTITGNAAANILDGAGDADLMRGRGGGDSYVVDNAGDVVDEGAAGSDGGDVVFSSVDFNLSDGVHILGEVENLTLTGAAVSGIGNALANLIIGNAGANTLDGQLGSDDMRGGAGNDIYVVAEAGDVADETGGSGIDLVRSSVAFNLSNTAHAKGAIEKLTLLGSANIKGTGNALANAIVGNAGKNTLDGKAGKDVLTGGAGKDLLIGGLGNDTMKGGAGADVYIVAQAGDIVSEAGGNGIDLVKSARSFSLSDAGHAKGAIEKLTLTGSGNTNAIGNALANTIIGNGGNNTLDGKGGMDTLNGGAGSDKFLFDTALSATKNVDHVRSFVRGKDKIVLDDDIFKQVGGSITADEILVTGTGAATALTRLLYDPTKGRLSYDPNGGDPGNAILFAILDNRPATLAASDFTVVA